MCIIYTAFQIPPSFQPSEHSELMVLQFFCVVTSVEFVPMFGIKMS
jgi:hypothetical protein